MISRHHYTHGTPLRSGVLLVNLGTPSAPTVRATRRFLRQFLSDPRVIEIPRPLWWFILNFFILPVRPFRTARIYQTVWQSDYPENGSPLMVHTRKQQKALSEHFRQTNPDIVCEVAMCYGEPSVETALGRLAGKNVQKLVILPLYPQYSASTAAAAHDAFARAASSLRWLPAYIFVSHYCDDDGYINACASQISVYREKHGAGDQLLLSFHGLPQRTLEAGDPYHCQCHKTARLIAERLQLDDSQWQLAFQSRFGAAEWLRPYTDQTLIDLAKADKSVDVFCPGFAADCIETLEEINIENRNNYIEAGGRQFRYIPALNDTAAHIQCLADIVLRHGRAWDDFGKTPSAADDADLQMQKQRALRLSRVREKDEGQGTSS